MFICIYVFKVMVNPRGYIYVSMYLCIDQPSLVCASEQCDSLEKVSPPRGIYHIATVLRNPSPSPDGSPHRSQDAHHGTGRLG